MEWHGWSCKVNHYVGVTQECILQYQGEDKIPYMAKVMQLLFEKEWCVANLHAKAIGGFEDEGWSNNVYSPKWF